MLGSQPKLSSVVESSVSWDLFLGCYRQDFDCDNNLNGHLKKAAKIWGRQHWFLRKMTFENDCRNFILATSCVTTQIWVVLLIAIFPSLMTNQKHYPELGIGTSTVWNFCSHFSDVILQGNQWWCWKMSAVFWNWVVQFRWCKVAMQLGVAMWVGTGLNVDSSSCSFPNAPFIWRQVIMSRRDISLQNVVNCLREKQKVGLAWRVTRPAGRDELVTKLGLRRTDNRFYYTLYSLSVARPGPRVSLAPKTPRSLPFQRLPRRLHFPQITHAADSPPAW